MGTFYWHVRCFRCDHHIEQCPPTTELTYRVIFFLSRKKETVMIMYVQICSCSTSEKGWRGVHALYLENDSLPRVMASLDRPYEQPSNPAPLLNLLRCEVTTQVYILCECFCCCRLCASYIRNKIWNKVETASSRELQSCNLVPERKLMLISCTIFSIKSHVVNYSKCHKDCTQAGSKITWILVWFESFIEFQWPLVEGENTLNISLTDTTFGV